MPARSNEQAALETMRDIVRDSAKETVAIQARNKALEAELEQSLASTEHWYAECQKLRERNKCLQIVLKQHEDSAEHMRVKHATLLDQARAGRDTFKLTIWRLVADRAVLRRQAQSLIAFWDENEQYLDGYYREEVLREYEALRKIL